MARGRGTAMLADFVEGLDNTSMDPMNALPQGGTDQSIEGVPTGAELSDIEKVLLEVGEAGDDAKIMVYRVDSATRKEAYLFQCQPGEFTLDKVLQQYGGGTFRIRGYASREGMRGSTLFVNRTVSLEEPKGGMAALNPQQAANDRLSDVLAQMAAMQAQTQQMIAAAMAPKPDNNDRMKWLQELQIMREIFGNGAGSPIPAPVTQPASPFAQLKEAMELVSLIKGQDAAASDPTTGLLMTLVEKLGGPIAEAAIAQAQASKSQSQVPVTAPLPPVLAPHPTLSIPAPLQPTSEEPDMNFLFKQAMSAIDGAAKANVDTSEFAGKIADIADVNKSAGDFVAQFIRSDNWLGMVKEHIPQADAQAEWYGRLRADLAALYEDDLPPAR